MSSIFLLNKSSSSSVCSVPSCTNKSNNVLKCINAECSAKIHIECAGFPRNTFTNKRDIDINKLKLKFTCEKCDKNGLNNNKIDDALSLVLNIVKNNHDCLNNVHFLINKQSSDLNNTISMVDEDGEKVRHLNSKIDNMNARLQRLDSNLEKLTTALEQQQQPSQCPSPSTELMKYLKLLECQILSVNTTMMNAENKIIKNLESMKNNLSTLMFNSITPMDENINQIMVQTSTITSTLPLLEGMKQSIIDIDDCLQQSLSLAKTNAVNTISTHLPLEHSHASSLTPSTNNKNDSNNAIQLEKQNMQFTADKITKTKQGKPTPTATKHDPPQQSTSNWKFLNDGSKRVWKAKWPSTDTSTKKNSKSKKNNKEFSNKNNKSKSNFKNPIDIDRLDEIIIEVEQSIQKPVESKLNRNKPILSSDTNFVPGSMALSDKNKNDPKLIPSLLDLEIPPLGPQP